MRTCQDLPNDLRQKEVSFVSDNESRPTQTETVQKVWFASQSVQASDTFFISGLVKILPAFGTVFILLETGLITKSLLRKFRFFPPQDRIFR